MKKSEVIIIGLCSLFVGVVIGFLISPVKKGIEIGNNSGNTNNFYGKDEECENGRES
jgi:hypothetical protein